MNSPITTAAMVHAMPGIAFMVSGLLSLDDGVIDEECDREEDDGPRERRTVRSLRVHASRRKRVQRIGDVTSRRRSAEFRMTEIEHCLPPCRDCSEPLQPRQPSFLIDEKCAEKDHEKDAIDDGGSSVRKSRDQDEARR